MVEVYLYLDIFVSGKLQHFRMKNYYNFLGLDINASPEEIKKAYRKLSLKFHPDKNDGDKFFEDRFKQINESYETLSNPAKKAAYDKQLLNFFQSSQANTFTEEQVRAYAEKIRKEYEEKLRQERAKHAEYSNRNRQASTPKQDPPKQQQTTQQTAPKHSTHPKQTKNSDNSGWIALAILLFVFAFIVIVTWGDSKTERDKLAEMQEGIRLFNNDRYSESFALLSQYIEEDFFTDEAYYCLGFMYGEGLGALEDDETANNIMVFLSEWEGSNFSKWANNYLGHQYYDGEGTSTNKVKAYNSFIKAARAGVPNAMFRTAQLYHKGEGTARDLKKAKYWYEKAAEYNIQEAIVALSTIDFKIRRQNNVKISSSPQDQAQPYQGNQYDYLVGLNIKTISNGTLWASDDPHNSIQIGSVPKGANITVINVGPMHSSYFFVNYNGQKGYMSVINLVK